MKRSNNKILLIVLIVLSSGFVLTKVFHAPSRERNLDEKILTLDTSQVSAIYISPAIQDSAQIRLIRFGSDWKVEMRARSANSEKSQVKNALSILGTIRADRVLTRNKEKWSSYHVDTTGTFVKVILDSNNAKEFWIGKMDTGGSCIRLEGHNEVYAIEGTLEPVFNKHFNDWRDKTFVKLQPEKISKITFDYPADTGFIVNKPGHSWEIGNNKADSSKVQSYLNKFKSRSLRDFADDFKPLTKPAYTITLNSGSDVITVHGWKIQDDRWVLNSSQQAGVYFSSSDSSFIRSLFVGKKGFLRL